MEVGNTEHLFASFSGMIAQPVFLQMLDQFSKSFLFLAPLGTEALWRNSDLRTNYAWLNSKKKKNYRFNKTYTLEWLLSYHVSHHITYVYISTYSKTFLLHRVSHLKLEKVIWLWDKEGKIFLTFYGTFFKKTYTHFDIFKACSYKKEMGNYEKSHEFLKNEQMVFFFIHIFKKVWKNKKKTKKSQQKTEKFEIFPFFLKFSFFSTHF